MYAPVRPRGPGTTLSARNRIDPCSYVVNNIISAKRVVRGRFYIFHFRLGILIRFASCQNSVGVDPIDPGVDLVVFAWGFSLKGRGRSKCCVYMLLSFYISVFTRYISAQTFIAAMAYHNGVSKYHQGKSTKNRQQQTHTLSRACWFSYART